MGLEEGGVGMCVCVVWFGVCVFVVCVCVSVVSMHLWSHLCSKFGCKKKILVCLPSMGRRGKDRCILLDLRLG